VVTPANGVVTLEQALTLAHGHWTAGQAHQAEQICRQILQAFPGQADANHLLGLIAHAHGQLEPALSHLRAACQVPGAPAEYFSNLGELCRQAGRLAEAQSAARRAVALAPELAGVWSNLGIILQEAGQLAESLECLQRVVTLAPEFAQGHNNLANTLRKLGQLEPAHRHYQTAIGLNPSYADAHSNLGDLLKDLGQYDQALKQVRQAIAAEPRLIAAYLNGAAIESARGRPAEALVWLTAVFDFAPRHAPARVAEANALRQLGQLPQAASAARAALEIAPDSAEAWLALGQVLEAADEIEPALDAYAQAIRHGGEHEAATIARIAEGTLLSEIGRLEQARTALAQACSVRPVRPSAWYHLGDLTRASADNGWLERLQDAIGKPERWGRLDRIAAHFALGKALLERGEAAAAFDHWDQGNLLKREGLAYDAAASQRWLEAIIAAFPDQDSVRPVAGAEASALPLFIVGLPRSGSSLVEQMLSGHPAIAGGGELPVLPRLLETVRAGDGQPVGYPQFLHAARDSDLAALGRLYLQQVGGRGGGRRYLTDKMPNNALALGLIRRMLPQARMIHVRRDPVDTCFSCYTTLFRTEHPYAYEQTELGRFCRGHHQVMAHWRQLLPAEHLLEVEYERLVVDPEGELRRMCAFLGLPYHPACLDFTGNPRRVATASAAQVREPLYRRAVGRGRAQARFLGPLLASLGPLAKEP